ncbi:unnamed protein product [Eretmochelys imbricata]
MHYQSGNQQGTWQVELGTRTKSSALGGPLPRDRVASLPAAAVLPPGTQSRSSSFPQLRLGALVMDQGPVALGAAQIQNKKMASATRSLHHCLPSHHGSSGNICFLRLPVPNHSSAPGKQIF